MGPRRHRRSTGIPRLALIALVLTACQPPVGNLQASSPSADGSVDGPARANAAIGRVLSVLDGDSLIVDLEGEEVEIRLAGVNAPERDECHADPARDALRDAVAGEVAIEIVSDDQFGRSVAGIWQGGSFVNGVLVHEGHAIATTEEGPWSADLIASEDAARQSQAGLWSPTACDETVEVAVTIQMSSPDPPGPDDLDDEHITLRNAGSSDIDLSGFIVRDESSVNRLRLPEGTTIPAGRSLRITTGCAPSQGIGWCASGPIWNNSGDSALLLAPGGTVVAHVRYAPDS
jgi:endonuclease YncB( thermonuclease family)